MSDRKFELSRRKALIGLGTVGAASAGAGLGTSAYFSDQEEFTDNSIQAGTFGLTVDQYVTNVDQDGLGPDQEDWEADQNDTGVWVNTPEIGIEDAKPGDEYEFCWEVTVEDNPGYVAVTGEYDDWNGVDVDNIELEDLWDIDDEEDLSTIGDEALVTELTITVPGEDDDETVYKFGGDYDTFGDLLDAIEDDGVLLHDEGGDGIQIEADQTVTVCLTLDIPGEDVGNELQGAKLEWDLTFYAEQARHNDPEDVKSEAAGL
ncbi:hypothetical protein AArcSl_2768 [Halalkaliarchaeum desulfuricum]|uniref:SipW-cognate class signal peptide n=1 Tax=Halalkaliarchaeum desulfuricum TaxID=2055893 RepID=A0A343TMR1_9EURY|nr:SipW-dependent-type signal peptide-containing protein [Halalkaliarchaeum desulfuricum]AUX10383.1 hypothetical protein AArcSl_2768 [Halalkaliarchaeum desulfuricum]